MGGSSHIYMDFSTHLRCVASIPSVVLHYYDTPSYLEPILPLKCFKTFKSQCFYHPSVVGVGDAIFCTYIQCFLFFHLQNAVSLTRLLDRIFQLSSRHVVDEPIIFGFLCVLCRISA
jgi:hypothetical protein